MNKFRIQTWKKFSDLNFYGSCENFINGKEVIPKSKNIDIVNGEICDIYYVEDVGITTIIKMRNSIYQVVVDNDTLVVGKKDVMGTINYDDVEKRWYSL